MEDAFAVASVAALEPDPVDALEGPDAPELEPLEEEAPDDDEDADEPDEPEGEVEKVPAGAALTPVQQEAADRRRMVELHALAGRILGQVETLLEEEPDLEVETLAFVLRLAARAHESRLRGNHGARHDGPMGRPKPPKVKVPFDPSRRAVVYRCHLGRSTLARVSEG